MPRLLFTLAAVIAFSHPSTARDNDLESWYIHCGLGYVNNTYPFEDNLDSLDELDHFALAVDLLGLYLPRGNRTLVGVGLNGSVDTYERTDAGEGGGDFLFLAPLEEESVYNYLYAVSVMHFLTHEIGQGPFVRADVGLARQVLEAADWGISIASDWGVGFLLGGGYGIPVTSGTRVLLNANFALREIEGDQTKSVGITLNGLF